MHWIAAISRSRVVYSAAEYEGLDAPRPKMGMLDERAESTLCAVLAANTTGHGCSARTAGSGWARGADMAGPDLPGPREPFTVAHLERWPMGAERTELLDGQLYWSGDFDERDAMVARRALPDRTSGLLDLPCTERPGRHRSA